MNFFLVFLLLIFLACLFLTGLDQNFTFRIIKRKLKWWILAHWGASILALLGKVFLLTVGPLQIFKGLEIGGDFAETWKIIQNRTFNFPLLWKNYQLEFQCFTIAYLIAVLVYTNLAYLHMYLGYILEDKIRERLIQLTLTRYIKLSYLESQVMRSKILNVWNVELVGMI
jgi:hypothetical protein